MLLKNHKVNKIAGYTHLHTMEMMFPSISRRQQLAVNKFHCSRHRQTQRERERETHARTHKPNSQREIDRLVVYQSSSSGLYFNFLNGQKRQQKRCCFLSLSLEMFAVWSNSDEHHIHFAQFAKSIDIHSTRDGIIG